MRTVEEVVDDLLKVNQEQLDWCEGMVFDRVPFKEKRSDFSTRIYLLVAELKKLNEFAEIKRQSRKGVAMAEDVIAVEYELGEIKKELQRMYVLIHKLQYPPNNDIKWMPTEVQRFRV